MFLAMPRERNVMRVVVLYILKCEEKEEGLSTCISIHTYLFHDIELQINSRQNITILYQDRTRCITLYHHLS